MTWSVYDLFVRECFPEIKSDSILAIWQKVNINRGFIAQNIFANKLQELYDRSESKRLETLYKPLLEWCKEIEEAITQPYIVNTDNETFSKIEDNMIVIEFSEPMEEVEMIHLNVYEFENGEQTENRKRVKIEHPEWEEGGKKVSFTLDVGYQEYAVQFFIWNRADGLYSKNDILLNPQNLLFVKN